MATTASIQASRFYADTDIPFAGMEIKDSFALLSSKEKLYTYWVSKASWAGVPIIQAQWTEYAQDLFKLMLLTFSSAPAKLADLEAIQSKAGVSKEEWTFALEYAAQVTSILTNYKSFGFSKYIPRVPKESFRKIVESSPQADEAVKLWDKLEAHIYSLEPEASLLVGKPNAGHISNYYLGETIQDADVEAVQAAIEKLKIAVENTRVRKNSAHHFTVLVASADSKSITHSYTHNDREITVNVEYGDFTKELHNAANALKEAKKYVANENQAKMLEGYIKSFETGDMEHYKEGSRWWVRDVGPVVESYIGFVESYVDPYGGRAEWEGFTAIVNKKLTAKYDNLVNGAPELIKTLPWGPKFEVDVFRKPDFTALEVVNFATGGIPAGINIPNYFDIRESVGFKNVSLANILAAKSNEEEITFVHPDDWALFREWDTRAVELQVANHELLGHGTGKLFTEDADGKLNFDPATTINPLTGKPVDSWYKPGQTAGSVLGTVSSSLEECRAETVAMYLCGNPEILSIFGYETTKDIEEIQYISFLLMARAGVRALEFYDPKAKKHLQAHMQARMGITNFFVKEGIATLEEVRSEDGKLTNAYIHVDRQKVLTQAQQIMGKLLLELQVRKSTADGPGAVKYYTELTNPLPRWDGELRDLVISKKQPRKIFVQPNLVVGKDGEVELKEYELSAAGAVQSFVEREIY